ncbi:SAM-dependent methyltransferase [Microlunatus elymi]|uniref:SAM-dependent methyltransferase n=1 Tax=Microlunatus elymi TaxID=2596828 RepID=UPI00143CD675|nr:SAM-dependent methyltransferase [Microlunatus elymi]
MTDDPSSVGPALDWQSVWAAAATGPAGFWRTHRVGGQFRTASRTSQLAEAIATLIGRSPELENVIEVGAGDGTLLTGLRTRLPGPRYAAAELRPAPAGVAPAGSGTPPDSDTEIGAGVDWRIGHWDVEQRRWHGPAAELFGDLDRPTMIICVEWLDDLPCPVVGWDGTTWRRLLVHPDGSESLGPTLRGATDDWMQHWWPDAEPGDRAECGITRDDAWRSLISALTRCGGLALMIDYGHTRDSRPRAGSLTGYVDGRQVPARPDPAINLTAHVAVDAAAAAGESAGASTEFLTDQQHALARLLPNADNPSLGTLGRLQQRSERRLLTQTLGDHRWLLQRVTPR